MPDAEATASSSANPGQGFASQRSGIRRQIDTLWRTVEPIVKAQIAYDEWELTKALRKLEAYAPRLVVLDQQIVGYIANDADRDADVDNAGDYYNDVMDKILNLQKSIADRGLPVPPQQRPGTSAMSGSGSGGAQAVSHKDYRMPKFEMARFSGDPMKWRGWWDIYKTAVHDNQKMSASQKFTYLLGYLDGEAYQIADGYELNDANYNNVIAELKERYGDKQRAQFAHFEGLFAIEKAKNQNLSEVQRVSNECERHIRSLTALEIDEDTFCVCFIPVLLKKLPTYLATKICEKNGAGKWSMANVRQWIKNDIRAREVGESATLGGFRSEGDEVCDAEEELETVQKENASVAVAQCDDEVRDVAFLPTAMATVVNEVATRTAHGRVLMDSASSRSYITERLCKTLELENVGSTYVSIGKFGTNKRTTTATKRVRFKIVCVDGSKQTVLANVTPIISCPVSRYPIDPKEYPEMQNLKLGEPLNERPDSLELDILIGSDQMYNFIEPSDVIDAGKGLVFQGSRLGYLTAGVMSVKSGNPIRENTLVLLIGESAPTAATRFRCNGPDGILKTVSDDVEKTGGIIRDFDGEKVTIGEDFDEKTAKHYRNSGSLGTKMQADGGFMMTGRFLMFDLRMTEDGDADDSGRQL